MRDRDSARDRWSDAHRQRRFLLAMAVLLALGLGLLAVAVRDGPLGVDIAAWNAAQHLGGPVAAILPALNVAGQSLVWDPVVIGIAILFALRGQRREAVVLVGTLLMVEAGTSGLKLLIDRERPPGVDVFNLVTQASFPSGHVARTVATLGVVAVVASRRQAHAVAAIAVAAVGSALMGIARVVSGEHWFSDVVGAALLALLVLVVVGLVVSILDERGTSPH